MADTLPDTIERLKKSICQVKLADDQGNGSGVVVDERGLIVTNRHVVGPNKTVTILDLEGKEYEGTLIRSDANIDYAIVKADIKEPHPAKWNDDPVREGMTVIAIGHPLGYEFTVTKGIVSTSKRVLQNVEYIQTDVPINPGNSGGPLIDEEGEILGINTWMRSDAQNIGFAIPIRYVLDALEEIEPLLDKLDQAEYCNVCGFLNAEETKYCNHCGVVMHRPKVEPKEQEQAPERPSHKVGSPETKKAETEPETGEDKQEAKAEPKEEATSDATFCIHCGMENPAVAKFCKKCGKPMS
ncbi:MAG: trypsin-like serine protease [bacterium]|nr:trypsin-like serine protease [bacterium]